MEHDEYLQARGRAVGKTAADETSTTPIDGTLPPVPVRMTNLHTYRAQIGYTLGTPAGHETPPPPSTPLGPLVVSRGLLEAADACDEGKGMFDAIFGDVLEVTLTRARVVALAGSFDFDWACRNLVRDTPDLTTACNALDARYDALCETTGLDPETVIERNREINVAWAEAFWTYASRDGLYTYDELRYNWCAGLHKYVT